MTSKEAEGDKREKSPGRSISPVEDPVQRNELGGVYVDEDELKAAFEFFDVHKRGVLTPADLKQRLGVFYKNLPAREYKFLVGEPDFTYKTLHKLLVNNELKDFDPVKEAFKVYDPHDTGFVDMDILKGIFVNLGFGDITPDDVQVLIETADVDNDGKISLADFRKMVSHSKAAEGDLDALHNSVTKK
uniref:EF-hand domain-containing protein n=2 Tax=Hemiselmis andersenii TaxID=464988 RepID=A0A7S0U1V1_HEMAN|mmetsp:Transcript_34866/g.81376  ORF Transcript_34866/g.81376 Transcript_34866/m.81376 type:complete len:188 (+) Transcript_34866:23-586(+)